MRLPTAARVVAAVAIVGIAVPAAAQRGGMGGMGGMGRRGRGEMGGNRPREETVEFPTAKDLEKFNPAALMIDKRKKLSLADSQVAAMTAIRSKIYERNASLLAQYDSIRKDFRPPKPEDRSRTGSTPETDSARVASLRQMEILRSLLDTLTARRTNDVGDVLQYLSAEKQHKTAVELLNDQDRDYSDKLPKFPSRGGFRPDSGGFGRGRRGGG